MQIKPNIRGTIRGLEIGDQFDIPFEIMQSDVVRTQASIVGLREKRTYSVKVDSEKSISTVTRIS